MGKQSQSSPLYMGKALGNAALPVQGWLRCDEVWGGDRRWQRSDSLAEKRLD